jgi:hypothetical protein
MVASVRRISRTFAPFPPPSSGPTTGSFIGFYTNSNFLAVHQLNFLAMLSLVKGNINRKKTRKEPRGKPRGISEYEFRRSPVPAFAGESPRV